VWLSEEAAAASRYADQEHRTYTGQKINEIYPPEKQTRSDSGDARTLGDMRDMNVSGQDTRAIAKNALRMISRGLQPSYCICLKHRLIVCKDPLGVFRDAGGSPHVADGKWGTSQCELIPVDASTVYDHTGTPIIGKLAESIVRMKKSIDEAVKAREIQEAQEKQGTRETFAEDMGSEPYNVLAARRADARRKRERVAEGQTVHINIQENDDD